MELIDEIREYAISHLDFSQSDGQIRWLKRPPRSKVVIGSIAGSIDKDGYRRICLKGRQYVASRISWLVNNGKFPKNQIDHINNDVSDNRVENLRDATSKQNSYNRRKPLSNTSGYKGVTFHKRDKRWQACVEVDGKTNFLGYFSSAESAHKSYCSAIDKLHGPYANYG